MSSYLLKITLHGTPHLIWRRFVVPSFTGLNRLHEIIQVMMGWQNNQTHAFYIRKQAYLPGSWKEEAPPKDKMPFSELKALPEETFSLDDLVYQSGTKLKYHYDPEGENWVHDIHVESIRYLNPQWPYPIYCLEGVRACPPESCGGVEGFCTLLKAIKDHDFTKDNKALARFASFDPDRFSIEKINKIYKVPGPVNFPGNEVISISDKKATQIEQSDPLRRLGRTLNKKAAS